MPYPRGVGGRDLGNAISFNASKISKALPLSASSVGKCWSWYVLTLLVLVKLSENFKRKANHRSIPLSTSRIGKGKRGVLVLMQEDVVTLFAGLWELFDLKTKQITEGGGREVRSDATKPKNADEKEPTNQTETESHFLSFNSLIAKLLRSWTGALNVCIFGYFGVELGHFVY